jgi:amino-acid N-acetyltransferase
MKTTIRQATEADIEGILKIVNHYAAKNFMLPRTADQIRHVLAHFLVAEQAGAVVGCGSLVQLTPQLTELRSLAVAADQRGTGLGRRLVEALVERATAAGYDQFCALTLQEGFFNNLGFATVDRWAVSPKIWTECIYCPKFDHCDEIAVLMNLTESETVSAEPGLDVSLGLWQQMKVGRMINR